MAAAASHPCPLRVEEIPGRGRAFVASRPIQAGEILLRDTPILIYPNLPLLTASFCFHCFRSLSSSVSIVPSSTYTSTTTTTTSTGTGSPTCPSCSLARFCSEACRLAALSSSHSPWPCRTLSALLHMNHSASHLLTQASFLVYSFNLSLTSPSAFSNLLSLHGTAPACHGLEEEKKSGGDDDSLFLRSLISSISPEFASFSPQLVSALLAKDKLNAFGLMAPVAAASGERAVRAYAIYPRASFFNHDCLPNACRFDYVDAAAAADGNTDIIVRSIHDIMQGREVCLSYFPVNWGYKDRQGRLMDDYGFTCHCDRCEVESHWKEEGGGGGGTDDEEAMDVDAAEEEEQEQEYHDDEVEAEVDVHERDNGDFPHAYFFMSYVCEQDNCGGTLAPLPPSSSQGMPTTHTNVMECNVCGLLRVDECKG